MQLDAKLKLQERKIFNEVLAAKVALAERIESLAREMQAATEVEKALQVEPRPSPSCGLPSLYGPSSALPPALPLPAPLPPRQEQSPKRTKPAESEPTEASTPEWLREAAVQMNVQ